MTKYLILFLFALIVFVPQQAHATAYYIDLSATTGGAGTATTSAFNSINAFTDVARNAGDIAFVRRGTASTTNIVAAAFTSDGTLNSPITLSADYDGLWEDDFSTAVETATPVFGTNAITLSASSTVPHGSWIYFGTDCTERYNNQATAPTGNVGVNPCEFAYEVASSTSGSYSGTPNTQLSLFLPYKGPSTGAGVSVRVMKAAPQVGTATEAAQILTPNADNNWIIKGFDLRSTNATGVVSLTGNVGIIFMDTVFQGNGASDIGIGNQTILRNSYFKKIRFFNFANAIAVSHSAGVFVDFLADCNNVASSNFLNNNSTPTLVFPTFVNGKITNCVNDFAINSASAAYIISKNVLRPNSTGITARTAASVFFEDDFGIVSLNSSAYGFAAANNTATTTVSTTTNLRSGGGPVNLLVFPPSGTGNTGISTQYFPSSYIKLFEYPIYSDAASHTYTMYFNSTSTGQWTNDPLTSTQSGSSTPELWIECEYYNDSSDADRFLKRSNTANDVDFNGSTAWENISITCVPTQAGILYLRGWYGKPKEAGGNIFYMDTTPEIQ